VTAASARGTIWTIGLLVIVGLLAFLVMDDSTRNLAFAAGLLGLLACALVAELAAAAFALARDRARTPPPPGARPADGVVDVVPMLGVEGEENPASPRFRRFAGLRGGPGEPAKVHKLPSLRPTLLGRVTLISVFVGRDGKGWTDEEIARGHASLERAGLWLEREATRHAAPVNLGLADVYFRVQDDEVDDVEVAFANEGDDVGPMEAHASTKAVVAASRAAATLGFADVVDLVGRIDPKVEADARVWLFHVRRSGRSLAVPAEECDVDGVGLAVCYSREASFPEPLGGPGRVDPTTVAHELLHLFGASDKYGVALRSFPAGSVSSRDIMRLDHDQLSKMTIDRLTASEVGWEPVASVASSTKNARRGPERGRRRARNWPANG
jgi:hypothetical protein